VAEVEEPKKRDLGDGVYVHGLWCKYPRPIVYSGLSGIRGGVVSKLSSFEEFFAGRHFDREVIILCVRW
jgi:hypothetical protein